MTLYKRITDKLDQMNKTRKDLCDATGLSYNTLTSQFQRESKNMKLDTIILIAQYLNVTVEYLVTGKENSLLIKDNNSSYLNSNDVIDQELIKIINTLDYKDKTILLAKAYELENKNK